MTASVGFRVGLLLEDFFSDLRRRCYFFVDTSKIQFISDLKESLVKKFELPSHVQLLHNRFLLLEEDPIQLLQQDDLIQVVEADAETDSKKEKKKKKRKSEAMQNTESSYSSPLTCDGAETSSSPIKKKKKHMHKDKHYDLGTSPKSQYNKSHDKNTINSETLATLDTSFERILTKSCDYSKLDSSRISDCHKKKKNSSESSLPNSQNMDFTVDGTAAFSSTCNYDLSLQRQSAGGELNNISWNNAYSVRNNMLKETLESVPDNVANSLKRKLKSEQIRLKYSGIAEVLKTIQSGGKTSVPDEVAINIDGQTEESSFVPKPKRKKVRSRRRKKNKLDESCSVSCSSQQSIKREAFKHVPVVESNVRLHKRFNSDENINLNANSQDIDNQDELNANLRLCNQISPLTPPSEHNSEDDVYKKLLDLRKMNKPVVFERKRSVDTNVIDDSGSSRLSANLVADVVIPLACGGADSHFVPLIYDQFNAAGSEEMLMAQAASSVHSNSDDVDKDNSSSGAESKSNDQDCSKKDTCPVHIKKNICDINLDKIDVNNYPVIENTRKNDILVFKTLKLSATLCPTVSSLILARVLDVSGDNVILFEILSGKEEFDHLKDEESDSPDSLISLKWSDLFEPRLVYP